MMKRNSVAEPSYGNYLDGTVNMESSSNSHLCGNQSDTFNNEIELVNQCEFVKCNLIEFSNSDLSDTESDNASCTSNSCNLDKLISSIIIANVSMPDEDLKYLLSCKVLLKPLSTVRISHGHDVS